MDICFCREVFGFCCEVFGFAVRSFTVFGFAVRFLVLSWGILFLPWGFWFCREVFCFCREVFGFAVTSSDSCGPPYLQLECPTYLPKMNLFPRTAFLPEGFENGIIQKVLDRRLYGVGQHFTFWRFSRKWKFFGNFHCDFRKCFTKGFFLTENEVFRNFSFDGEFSIFTDSQLQQHPCSKTLTSFLKSIALNKAAVSSATRGSVHFTSSHPLIRTLHLWLPNSGLFNTWFLCLDIKALCITYLSGGLQLL